MGPRSYFYPAWRKGKGWNWQFIWSGQKGGLSNVSGAELLSSDSREDCLTVKTLEGQFIHILDTGNVGCSKEIYRGNWAVWGLESLPSSSMKLVSNGTCYASSKSQELDNFVPFFSPKELAPFAFMEEKNFTTEVRIHLKNKKHIYSWKLLVSSDLLFYTFTMLLDWFIYIFFYFLTIIFCSCAYEACCLGSQIIDVDLIKYTVSHVQYLI